MTSIGAGRRKIQKKRAAEPKHLGFPVTLAGHRCMLLC